jgi:hypothetical protein
VSWGELIYTGVDGLEIALFDALAYDVAYMIGTRTKWTFAENQALVGYLRYEEDLGDAGADNAHAVGLSYQTKIKDVSLDAGYFGVHGDDLRFEETTTGINHPLGSSMMIYAQQFDAGADTAYLKAVTKLDKTVLYALYNYTWHGEKAYDAQELNVVVKQPITDNLSIAFKGGVAGRTGGQDTTATDARVFITWTF